ncbi:UNVERIFIED_CONTAM: hypothetical protein HDU68_006189 [Siphonaria sp. JEL0065]|nr:hypothetical protein HDU68_006189 [Siphonaria sp. JEL0065]
MTTLIQTTATANSIRSVLQFFSKNSKHEFPHQLAGPLFRILLSLEEDQTKVTNNSDNSTYNSNELLHILLIVKNTENGTEGQNTNNPIPLTLELLQAIEETLLAIAVVLQYIDIYEVCPWFNAGEGLVELRQEMVKTVLSGVNGLSGKSEQEPPLLQLNGWPDEEAKIARSLSKTVVWDDGGELYSLYVLGDEIELETAVEIGQEWVDQITGKTFVMDRLTKEDIKVVQENSTVGYRDDYYELVLGNPHLANLSRCIREVAGDGAKIPVSWILVHTNYSLGLACTLPAYTLQGFGQKALNSLLHEYRKVVEQQWALHVDGGGRKLKAYNFIDDNNEGSKRQFKMFFKEGRKVEWIGIQV